MHVLIAGAGVGGLTLALSLHERGIACTIAEAAERVRELGVGINALPHAVAELAALGLLPALDAVAIRTATLLYANRFGQTIWREPRGIAAGHAVPQFSIHRGRLQGVLLRAVLERLGEGAVRTGHRLLESTQDADGVAAHCATAGGDVTLRGDVLVGADGIHSALRRALHPDDGGIRWTGIQLWRGATEWPVWEGGAAMLVAGDMTEKVVFYPIAPGATAETRLTNWALAVRIAAPGTPAPSREDWSRRADAAAVLPHVARFHLPGLDLDALVRATDAIFEYPMADRDPLPWWTRGRLTLLGDAAHPMYPTGSNGAAQAILDARCLARCLAEHGAAGLAAYEAERRPRTEAVVLSNRRGGPERMLDEVSARAPDGFARIDDVIAPTELAAIGGQYAATAGFAAAR